MASSVAVAATAEAGPPSRRRPRRKAPTAVGGGDHHDRAHNGGSNVNHGYSTRDITKPSRPRVPPPPPPSLSVAGRLGALTAGNHSRGASHVWALLRKAQEEMDHGTDALRDELNKLWHIVRQVASADVVRGHDENDEGCREESQRRSGDEGGRDNGSTMPKDGQPGTSAAAAGKGRRRREQGGGHAASQPRPTLPPEDVDALLSGLAQLQSEMESEVRSFRQQKASLVSKLESVGPGLSGDSRRREGENRRVVRGTNGGDGLGEVSAMEDEAEAMRARVVASRARLLGRVRELQGLPRRLAVSLDAATAANTNTTSSSTGTTAPADRITGSGDSLNDLVDSAHAVLTAREELAGLKEAIEAKRKELAVETSRGRAASEQTSRLESLRSSAAAAAARAKRDAEHARAEANTAAHALDMTKEGLAAAEASRRSAEREAESALQRLASLRREETELNAGLRVAAREVREREARSAAAAMAAEGEEERLADCRDSFGLEVEGLQKGVGELESEARRWRETLKQTHARLRAEEEEGRTVKAILENEKAEKLGEVERLTIEARELEKSVRDLRRRRESERSALTRETGAAAGELSALKSRLAETHSSLEAGNAELEALEKSLDATAAAVRTREEKLGSMERRSAELAAHVLTLEAERKQAERDGDTARRRQEEELSRWGKAVAERREEYERMTEMTRDKVASLGDLEKQAKARVASARTARGDQDAAEARAQAILRAAREATSLAERAREKADREESRAAAAEARAVEVAEQVRRQEAEVESQRESLGKTLADLEEARRAASEMQAEARHERQELAALTEKRREEQAVVEAARHRATALAREEASVRAAAAAARRERAEGRDTVTAARGELAELLETVDRERRTLESFRDQVAAMEADLARKKEEDRFAREAADTQQSRLDEIKREVTLLRDERLRVEKSVWELKSELTALTTKRDDAARRDRRREREEAALAARRDALVDAAAREEERVNLTVTAKEALEAEVAELDTRAGVLTAEASAAAEQASALRADAAAAAGRAEESRKDLAALQNQAARVASETDALRATKDALTAELNGLRHELDTLRGDRGNNGSGGGAKRRSSSGSGSIISVGGLTSAGMQNTRQLPSGTEDSSNYSSARLRGRGYDGAGQDLPRDDYVKDERETYRGSFREAADVRKSSGDGSSGWDGRGGGGGGDGAGNLIEVVAEFQGKLRKQVQAALASAGSKSVGFNREADGVQESLPDKGRRTVDAVLSRQAAAGSSVDATGLPPRRGQQGVVFSTSRRGSCQNVLGELGRRVGSV